MAPLWQPTSIAGRAAELFEPKRARPGALIWLRDETGELPLELAGLLEQHQMRCVAPQARSVWWLDRIEPAFDSHISPERYLIEHVVPLLGTRVVAVAGVGRGGQGALRAALRHPNHFPVAASVDGAFDFHEHFGHGTSLDDLYPSR